MCTCKAITKWEYSAGDRKIIIKLSFNFFQKLVVRSVTKQKLQVRFIIFSILRRLDSRLKSD